MSTYEIVPATLAHAIELSTTMAQADRNEIWASSHATPIEALRRGMDQGDAFSGLADGRAVCMFGVVPVGILSNTACIWMLGSESLPRYAKPFLRRNRPWLSQVSSRYSVLFNFVDARNENAIKWLRWLGFTLGPAIPYGQDKLPFHPFELRS